MEATLQTQSKDVEGLWQDPKEFWGYPRIPQPKIVETLEDVDIDENMKPLLASEVAYLHDAQIYVSMPNLRKRLNPRNEEDEQRCLEAILYHEGGHYGLIPFDFRTHLFLIHNAAQGLKDGGKGKNVQNAAIVANLFDDIIVNSYLVEHGVEEIPVLYDRINETKKSGFLRLLTGSDKMWNVYMRSLERLWEQPDRFVGKLDYKSESAARQVADLFKENAYSSATWPDRVYEFAKTIAPFLGSPRQNRKSLPFEKGSCGELNSAKQQSSRGRQTLRKIEKKLRGLGRQISERERKKSGKKSSCDEDMCLEDDKGIENYRNILAGCGIVSSSQKADVWFYRDLADQHTIKFSPVQGKVGETGPESPQKWSSSDPVEQLDLAYSVLSSGKPIPDIGTYKWQSRDVIGFKDGNSNPDLYVILDSSGSMPNPRQTVSPAVLSSMVAAHSALNLGARVGVINFSGGTFGGEGNRKVVKETDDRDKIDEALVTYFGGGTVLPCRDITGLVENTYRPKQFLLVSDSYIWNFDEAFPFIERAMKTNPANHGALFLLGYGDESVTEKMKSVGYEVFNVNGQRDLFDMVLGKTKQIYGGLQ